MRLWRFLCLLMNQKKSFASYLFQVLLVFFFCATLHPFITSPPAYMVTSVILIQWNIVVSLVSSVIWLRACIYGLPLKPFCPQIFVQVVRNSQLKFDICCKTCAIITLISCIESLALDHMCCLTSLGASSPSITYKFFS